MINSCPIHVTSVSQEVHLRLKRIITSGQLRPGTAVRLRSPGVLLRISSAPVREAWFRLECEGLVQYGRRCPAYVVRGCLKSLSVRLERAAEQIIHELQPADHTTYPDDTINSSTPLYRC